MAVPEQRDRSRVPLPCGQIIRLRDGSPVYFIVECVEREGHDTHSAKTKHRAIVSADISTSTRDRRRVTTEVIWGDE